MEGFSLGRLHMGGTSAEGQNINGRLMRGDIDLMGGPNFDRLYHELKVSCNYTINLSAMILLKLIDLHVIAFKFAQ